MNHEIPEANHGTEIEKDQGTPEVNQETEAEKEDPEKEGRKATPETELNRETDKKEEAEVKESILSHSKKGITKKREIPLLVQLVQVGLILLCVVNIMIGYLKIMFFSE